MSFYKESVNNLKYIFLEDSWNSNNGCKIGTKDSDLLLDNGPPEFVPGKKWEWRDPNKMAEDPNATPGTCKPNPLLALNTLQQFSIISMTPNNNNNTIRGNFTSNTQQTFISGNETKVNINIKLLLLND